MNCRGVSRRLSAYIDGELSVGIRGSIDDHLGVCADCERKLAELTAISQAARALPPLEVSEGFKERVLEAAVGSREKAVTFSGFKMKAALSGLAFVATAAAVFFIAGPKMPSDTPLTQVPGINTDTNSQSNKFPVAPDFDENNRVKLESFPIPDDVRKVDLAENDSSLLNDSTKAENYILPVVRKDRERKVNVKF